MNIMKEKHIELSVEELETLCTLYIECKLSVLEETELYYVLLKTDKNSALINEIRTIMGIERKIAISQPMNIRKKPFYKQFYFYGVAATLIGIILSVFIPMVKDMLVADHPTILAQKIDEDLASKPLDEEKSRPGFIPETQNGLKTNNESNVLALSKNSIKSSESQAKESKSELNNYDDYVEITNENEATIILQNVNEKITAILEKGINAQNKMPDIDEKINNLLNKI